MLQSWVVPNNATGAAYHTSKAAGNFVPGLQPAKLAQVEERLVRRSDTGASLTTTVPCL